jgi:gliding motility-associated-like protein
MKYLLFSIPILLYLAKLKLASGDYLNWDLRLTNVAICTWKTTETLSGSFSASHEIDVERKISAKLNSNNSVLYLKDGDGGTSSIKFLLLKEEIDCTFKKCFPQEVPKLGGNFAFAAYKCYLKSTLPEDTPVKLTLRYPTIKEKNLGLYFYDSIKWRPLNSKVNNSIRVIEATSPFSKGIWGIFKAQPLEEKGIEIKPEPSIITPNGDGKNDFCIFAPLQEPYEISIFEITGRKIRKIKPPYSTWDGKDEAGKVVENGVYIYFIEAANYKGSGIIAVAK